MNVKSPFSWPCLCLRLTLKLGTIFQWNHTFFCFSELCFVTKLFCSLIGRENLICFDFWISRLILTRKLRAANLRLWIVHVDFFVFARPCRAQQRGSASSANQSEGANPKNLTLIGSGFAIAKTKQNVTKFFTKNYKAQKTYSDNFELVSISCQFSF